MSTTGGLIGRDRVLAALRASFDQAAAGQGQLVLISGEAGIGKTVIAGAAAGQAAAQGALVLWGRCSETEGAPPFWPWAQIVRAAADAGTRPPETVGALGWAAPAELTDVSGDASSRARFRLFDATARFLAQAGGDHADLARAALGLHAVGAKTGPSAEREQTIALLQQAAGTVGPVAGTAGLAADLAARVNAALARDLYHSLDASRTRQARQPP